jgi:hypothetical protein
MKHATRFTAGAFVAALAGVGAALATPQMLTEAKKAGMPAANCQYCHTEALPKKETFKPETLNDRGKFLLTDKQKRNLKSPDLEKLKEFPAAKEQK